MDGWMGKILHVDLGASDTWESPTEPYIEDYVGGRGIAARQDRRDTRARPGRAAHRLVEVPVSLTVRWSYSVFLPTFIR